jgi:hypothetical protein
LILVVLDDEEGFLVAVMSFSTSGASSRSAMQT